MAEEILDGGDVDIATLANAIENTQPSEDGWCVCGGDDFLLVIMTSARAAGVTVTRIDASGAAGVANGKLVIVELPGGDGEKVLEDAAKAGALTVAVLDEPTIDWFTKAVKGGAYDVLAGKATPEAVAGRAAKWRAKITSA